MIKTKQEKNQEHLIRLRRLIESKQLEIFHKYFSMDPTSLYQELFKHKGEIEKLLKKKVIRQEQFECIFPASLKTDSKEFDSTLLQFLLRTVCGFSMPITGWNSEPDGNDTTAVANLIRLKIGRNEISHLSIAKATDIKCRKIYQYLKQPLLDLGCTTQDLDKFPPIQFKFLPAVPSFTSREDEIEKIHFELEKSKKSPGIMGLVITGLAGIGKTQLARKYFEKNSDFFDNNIVWINANTLENSFEGIAEALELNIKDEFGKNIYIDAIITKVHNYFAKDRVLFVFDNVDTNDKSEEIGSNENQLLKYLPVFPNIYTIITSQNKHWNQQFKTMQLSIFNEKEAANFVTKGLTESAPIAVINDIVNLMGHHPLGLQQAISYINKTKITSESYFHLLKSQPQEVLSRCAVFGAFKVALDKISSYENTSLALKILNTICHMNGKEIKKRFFVLLKFGDCFNENKNILEINDAMALLESYSLINLSSLHFNDTKEDIITVHSLVQEAVINMQDRKQLQYKLFSEFMCQIVIDYDLLKPAFRLEKHFFDQFIYIFQSNKNHKGLLLKDNDYREFVSSITIQLSETGRIEKSITLFKEVNDAQFQVLGKEHPSFLITKTHITQQLAETGQIEESLVLLNEVKDVERRILGEEHPSFLITKANIAQQLAETGQIEESLVLLNEVKDVQRRILGEEHPSFLITKANIAEQLAETGQIEESLVLLNEVKDVQRRILGEEHPSFLIKKVILLNNWLKRDKSKSHLYY